MNTMRRHGVRAAEGFGGQAEPGYQERSDQQINRLDDVHEEVSQGCLDMAILPPRNLNIESRNSLTQNEYGVISTDTCEDLGPKRATRNAVARGDL